MLHRKEIIIETISKARKLPRLIMIALFPIILTQIIALPLFIVAMFQSFCVVFLFMAWIEGVILSLKVVFEIEENGKTYNVIAHLYDMEFDPLCLNVRNDQK